MEKCRKPWIRFFQKSFNKFLRTVFCGTKEQNIFRFFNVLRLYKWKITKWFNLKTVINWIESLQNSVISSRYFIYLMTSLFFFFFSDSFTSERVYAADIVSMVKRKEIVKDLFMYIVLEANILLLLRPTQVVDLEVTKWRVDQVPCPQEASIEEWR